MELKNTYNISEISFEKEISAFCPIGKDYYQANIYVSIEPNENLFDFIDADRFVCSLAGKEAIVEKLVSDVFDYFKKYAKDLTVTVDAKSNTHFPVSVTKTL